MDFYIEIAQGIEKYKWIKKKNQLNLLITNICVQFAE